MPPITLALIDVLNDRRLTLSLPDDVPLEQLVPALARKLGLPEGEYVLTVAGADAPLAAEVTVAGAGVSEGTTLRLEHAATKAPLVEAAPPPPVEAPLAEPAPPPPAPRPIAAPDRKAALPGWAWAVGGVVLLAAALAVGGMLASRQAAERTAATATVQARHWQATVVAQAQAVDQAASTATAEAQSRYCIAFVSDRDGNKEIYVMDADGSVQTNLTNNPADDRFPAWSPDSGHIAFVSDRDGNWEIYVMNADGTGVTRLTDNPANDWSPAWSSDGRRIAFYSYRDDSAEIYIMNADGTSLQGPTDIGEISDPAWSSDGRRIGFVSERDAKLIIPDHCFTHSASQADVYAPVRSGTDSIFYAGLMKYIIDNELPYRHAEYLVRFTNAAILVSPDFMSPVDLAEFKGPADLDGFFSGFADEDGDGFGEYRPSTLAHLYQITADGYLLRDLTLQHPCCVFQITKRHYDHYDLDTVSEITACPTQKLEEVYKLYTSISAP